MPRPLSRLVVACALIVAACGSIARGDIFVTNFYNNTVDIYDEDTLQPIQQGFFQAPTMGFAGLTAVAVNPVTKQVYVSGQQDGVIYMFDGVTGNPTPAANTPTGITGVFKTAFSAGFAPARLAMDSTGNLWVGDFAGNGAKSYNSTTGALVTDLSTLPGGNGGPGPAVVSALAFDSAGALYVGDASSSVVSKFSGGNLSFFSVSGINGPATPAGIAIDGSGNVYVADLGLAPGFGGNIFKYSAAGALLGNPLIDVDSFMPPPNGTPSFPSSAPSSLLIDANGDLIVATLGPTNPADGGPDGALLRFAPDGTFLLTSVTDLDAPRFAFGGMAFVPFATTADVPEPSTLLAFVACFLTMIGAIGLRRRTRR